MFGSVSSPPAALISDDFDYAEYNALFVDSSPDEDTFSLFGDSLIDDTTVTPDFSLFSDFDSDEIEPFALYGEDDQYVSLLQD